MRISGPLGVHGRTVEGVPRWIVPAAYATTLTTLPSGIWRIALGLGAPLGPPDTGEGGPKGDLPSWMPGLAYLVWLSVVTEALAFLTVGLVSRWGEVFPSWMPVLGGRRVPTLGAVVPAALGAVVLMVGTLWWAPSFNEFTGPDGAVVHLGGWKLAVFVLSYGPLLAWGPLLAVVTAAYYLRRARSGAEGQPPAAQVDEERAPALHCGQRWSGSAVTPLKSPVRNGRSRW